MTLEELICSYRAQSLDHHAPYFCSDALLTSYANEAQVEACRRGQLLVSTSTVSIPSGAKEVAVPAGALRVTRAFVNGQPVDEITADAMDLHHPGWQDQESSGMTRYLVSGLNNDKFALWPIPDKAYKLRLSYQRLPLTTMRLGGGNSPEIRPELHPAFVEWMMYRAYSRTDSDLLDPARAALSLANFEAEFGRKASGRNEEWVRSGLELMPGPIA